MPYGHASMLLLGEGSEATEPYNKYDKILAFHSIPAIRSKGSTSVLSTRKIRPIYSHPLAMRSQMKRLNPQSHIQQPSLNLHPQVPLCTASNAPLKGNKTFRHKTFRQQEEQSVVFFSMKRSPYMSPFPLVPRGPLGPLIFPSC